jgi:hypothetical protein
LRLGSRSRLLLWSRSLFKLGTRLLLWRHGPGRGLRLGLGLNRPALRLLRSGLRLVLRAGLLRLNRTVLRLILRTGLLRLDRANLRLAGPVVRLDRSGLGLGRLDWLHLRTVV